MRSGAVIGERLFKLRDERGWSQKALARRSGVSHTTIVHLETGQVETPRMPTVRKLARTFGLSAEEFAGTEWEYAVEKARSLREDGRERLDELMEAWRERKDASGGGSAALLDRIGGLLQEAHEAEKALSSAGADGRPGAPATDEFISELQEASRFYGELRGRIEGAGLRVRRGDREQVLAA